MSAHSSTVCCPPARGPCVMAGTPASELKLFPSSTNSFGPIGSGDPLTAAWRLLERGDERVGLVQPERPADEPPVEIGGHPVVARHVRQQAAELGFDLRGVGAGQPAAGALQHTLLRGLVVDFAGVNLADERARLAGRRIDPGGDAGVQRQDRPGRGRPRRRSRSACRPAA